MIPWRIPSLSPKLQSCPRPAFHTFGMSSRNFSDLRDKPRLYRWSVENLNRDPEITQPASTRQTFTSSHSIDQRIYILGIGNIGRLYAHCLAKSKDRPPITLVVHRRSLLEQWVAAPGIEMVSNDGSSEKITSFDLEWWTDEAPKQGPVREPVDGGAISNLIIATKASDALPQVDRLRKYLNGDSVVAFAQNGMCKLWPPLGDAFVESRFPNDNVPRWIACVTTHGVTSLGPFRSRHASPADAKVGTVSSGASNRNKAAYLMKQLCDAPGLDATRISSKQLWISQLEKLAVNVVINPITALLRCKNGAMFIENGDDMPKVISLLIAEASELFQALVEDPSSAVILKDAAANADQHNGTAPVSSEALLQRFSTESLTKLVYDVGRKVAENTSSMLQDVRAGKKTEIRDLNGWLVETARALHSKHCNLPTHTKMIRLVEKGDAMDRKELCEHLVAH